MIELVAAMTIMLIGVLAVFTLFQAGIVHLRRATTVTTAGALADAEMERFRAGRHETLGLDASEVAALVTAENPDVYAADEAYAPGTATTMVTGGLTSTATTLTVAGWSGFPASPNSGSRSTAKSSSSAQALGQRPGLSSAVGTARAPPRRRCHRHADRTRCGRSMLAGRVAVHGPPPVEDLDGGRRQELPGGHLRHLEPGRERRRRRRPRGEEADRRRP